MGTESTCKSCKTAILWVITDKGKPTPIDAKKVRVVTKLLQLDNGDLKIEEVMEGHVSHWSTCPSAEQHRNR